MEEFIDEINRKHGIRFYKEQKEKFCAFAVQEFKKLGYEVNVDKLGNVVVGHPEAAKVVYSGHYDTPGAVNMLFISDRLNKAVGTGKGVALSSYTLAAAVAGSMRYTYDVLGNIGPVAQAVAFIAAIGITGKFPHKQNVNDNASGVAAVYAMAQKNDPANKDIAYILFNKEEGGWWRDGVKPKVGTKGSGLYVKEFKKRYGHEPNFNLVNFDSVGLGELSIASNKKNRKDIVANIADTLDIKKDSGTSDHVNFEHAVSVFATKDAKIGKGRYMPHIHSRRDLEYDPDAIKGVVNDIYSVQDKLVELYDVRLAGGGGPEENLGLLRRFALKCREFLSKESGRSVPAPHTTEKILKPR
ncbi:MAG: M28 family peptidase [Firmicutes bacterium]|nr:M28 family peptidase [Bacillota bacterium]